MTTPLYERLKDASPKAFSMLGQIMTGFSILLFSVKDELDAWDYAQSLDDLFTALGIPDNEQPEVRPVHLPTDDRPLAKRLDQSSPAVAKRLAQGMMMLTLTVSLIEDDDLRTEYAQVLRTFTGKLIGKTDDVSPEARTPGPVAVSDEQKQQEVAHLEELFGLDAVPEPEQQDDAA